MAISWVTVLTLPRELAAIVTPSEAASILKPVIVNSLAIIIITTQPGILPTSTKRIKAAATNILSANGSINFPKVVIRSIPLAIYPSKVSVRAAIIKIIAAYKWALGKLELKTSIKIGTKNTLHIVILLAKFMIKPPSSVYYMLNNL